jgi:exosortase E/protease (VPEID-CTERM system)
VALPWRRWTLAAGLLLVEYLVLSVVYEVGPLTSSSWVIGHSGVVAPVAFLALTALLTLWRTPRPETRNELAVVSQRPRWGWLVAHLLCAATFFPISHRVLGRPDFVPTFSAAWLAAWIASGLAVVATAVALAFPLRALRPLLHMAGRPAAGGLLVALVAWVAGSEAQWLWPWLARATLNLAATLMAPLGGDQVVVSVPERLLGLRDFTAEISNTCSGAEGMGLVGVLAAAYLIKFRHALVFPRALVVVPLAMAGAFLGNVLRIIALVWIGAAVSPDVAFQGFHSKAGWVMTCFIAVAVLTWVRRSRWLNRATETVPTDHTDNPTASYLAPLLTSAALSLVIGLFSTGFDRLFWLRVVGTALALLAVRAAFAGAFGRPRLAGLPIGVGLLVFVGWLAIARAAEPTQITGVQAGLAALGPTSRNLWLVARVVGAVVIVPLTEELAFRGFLLRRLVSAEFWDFEYAAAARRPVAVVLSSLVFGALHGAFIAGTLAGIAYALVLRLRGRLGDAIVAHAITNALLVLYTLLTGDWSYMA